jgi:hypothetical protein
VLILVSSGFSPGLSSDFVIRAVGCHLASRILQAKQILLLLDAKQYKQERLKEL